MAVNAVARISFFTGVAATNQRAENWPPKGRNLMKIVLFSSAAPARTTSLSTHSAIGIPPYSVLL
jgi:hypothetical protein